MSKIARVVASVPERSLAATWGTIIDLLAPDPNSPARAELRRVEGVACATLAEEAPIDDAFVVSGGGPRVHVYCVFGESATSGDGVVEDQLPRCPTTGDWRLSIPCRTDDLEWMQQKLKSLSARVTARALGEEVPDDTPTKAAASSGAAAINLQEFMRP